MNLLEAEIEIPPLYGMGIQKEVTFPKLNVKFVIILEKDTGC